MKDELLTVSDVERREVERLEANGNMDRMTKEVLKCLISNEYRMSKYSEKK